MNNTFRFMAVLATVAAVLASCAKAEIDSPAGENADGSNVYQGPVKTLTFTAQTGAPQTKTSLGEVVTDTDGNKTQPVLWDEKDNIKIMFMVDGTEYSVTATAKSVDGSSAVFEAEVPESGVENYYAVYPATTLSTLTMGEKEAGEIRVTIESGADNAEVRKGLFKNANIMVAKCAASDPVLNFKHACSIVKFRTGNVAPGQVYFYSGDRKYNRGYSYINFDSSNIISTITTAEQSDKYSYVNATEANTDYYMAIWPDYTLKDGFIIAFRSPRFINTEGGWRVAYHPNDVTLARGGILDLGVIQDKIRTDYFVASKAKGKQDGSSWDNACDITYVRNMFAEPADYDYAYAQQMKLENTNFWFAGDATFVFGTEETPRLDMCFAAASKGNRCPINFYGGCTGTTGTDKTRDPKGHPTVFSGDGKYAILSVRNKTTLTLDGITLKDAVATQELQSIDGFYGAALYVAMNTGASNNGEEFFPIVNINNCKFVDNKETESLSDVYGGGAALNIGTGKVYVHNSIISNSQAYNRGAAVRISDDAIDGTKVYFNSCVFSGNNVTSGFGHVMWIKSINGDAAFNNCNFHTNGTTGTTGSARAVLNLCNNNIINNCTFYESTEKYNENHGIVRYIKASASAVATYANNIVYDIKGRRTLYLDKTDYSVSSKGYNLLIGKYGTYIIIDDTDKTDLGNFTMVLDESLGYYTWDGVISDFEKATADAMIAATTANSNIGDDFYNWLVQIGAIVNGQFTDCRGYLRPTDAMCPGAYDPNATQPTL